jgi:hypothetical protein
MTKNIPAWIARPLFYIPAALFGAYLIFGFLLLEPIVKQALPWFAENKMASRASVEAVEFNPLLLDLTVSGFKLAEPSGAPLASFDTLHVDVEASGLFRWAWKVRDITLTGPRGHVEIRPGGRLNWADLIEAMKDEEEKPPKDTLPRVLLESIRIENGGFTYLDRNRPQPHQVSMTPLSLSLAGISTLPEDRGDHLFAADLPEHGGRIKWDGDVSLNPITSRGRLVLERLDLPHLLRAAKGLNLPVRIESGKVGARLGYGFAMVKDKPLLNLARVHVALDDFKARLADSPASVGFERLGIDIATLHFALREASPALRLGGLGATLERASFGATQPVARLEQLALGGGGFDLDTMKFEAQVLRVAGLQLAAQRGVDGAIDVLALLPKSRPAGASPPSPAKAAPATKTAAKPAPAKPLQFAISELRIEDLGARFTDRQYARPLAVQLERLDASAALAGSTAPDGLKLTLDGIGVELGAVHLDSDTDRMLTLDRVRLEQGRFDLAGKRLDIEAIRASGLRTEVVMANNGKLNWLDALARHAQAPPSAPAAAKRPSAPPPIALALKTFSLDGIALRYADNTLAKPALLGLEQGYVRVADISLDLMRRLPVQVGWRFMHGGGFTAKGSVAPGAPRVDLRFAMDRLGIVHAAPYVNKFAKLTLHGGDLSVDGRVRYDGSRGKPEVRFDGGFASEGLDIREEEGGADFLKWKRLASENVSVSLNPNRVEIGTLDAVQPYAKIIIYEDKTLNVKRMLRSNGASPPQEAAPPPKEVVPAPAAAEPAKAETKPAAFPVRVERIRIEDAGGEFADLSITPQFGTRMHSLNGNVSGMSTDPATYATVDIEGKVDEFGQAIIRGSVQPFQATEFTDLELIFRNIEMANMTPYSGKFAGRRIDSGRLSVELQYKIKQRQLAGENKFIINKLRLGERVESKEAKNLPLDLAIAILEDSEGVIDLDLPVSGSLDDPEFSYGKIVWKAIVNVIGKIVTAPFKALGKLFGGSGEKVDALVFDAGSAKLAPPEKEKLKAVAQILEKRPGLAVAVVPAFDTAADTPALKEATLRWMVANRMGAKLAPGEPPPPLDLSHDRTQKMLDTLVAEASTREQQAKLRETHAKDGDHGRGLAEARAAFLREKTVVSETDLKELAQARGEAAVRELTEAFKADPARVSAAPGGKADAGGKTVTTKLELGVAKGVK